MTDGAHSHASDPAIAQGDATLQGEIDLLMARVAKLEAGVTLTLKAIPGDRTVSLNWS